MPIYETAHCWACECLTTYDPQRVPRANGIPLCARCVAQYNEFARTRIIIEKGTYPDD